MYVNIVVEENLFTSTRIRPLNGHFEMKVMA